MDLFLLKYVLWRWLVFLWLSTVAALGHKGVACLTLLYLLRLTVLTLAMLQLLLHLVDAQGLCYYLAVKLVFCVELSAVTRKILVLLKQWKLGQQYFLTLCLQQLYLQLVREPLLDLAAVKRLPH